MAVTIAQAEIEFIIDNSNLSKGLKDTKAQSDKVGKSIAKNIQGNFDKVNTKKLKRSFTERTIEIGKMGDMVETFAGAALKWTEALAALSAAAVAIPVAKFLQSAGGEATGLKIRLEQAGKALAELGGRILDVKVFGKDAGEWIDVFTEKIKNLTDDEVARLVKSFTTLATIVAGLKFVEILGFSAKEAKNIAEVLREVKAARIARAGGDALSTSAMLAGGAGAGNLLGKGIEKFGPALMQNTRSSRGIASQIGKMVAKMEASPFFRGESKSGIRTFGGTDVRGAIATDDLMNKFRKTLQKFRKRIEPLIARRPRGLQTMAQGYIASRTGLGLEQVLGKTPNIGQKALAGVGTALGKLKKHIVRFSAMLITAIKALGKGIVAFFGSALAKFLLLAALFVWLGVIIKSAIPELPEGLKKAIKALIKALKDLGNGVIIFIQWLTEKAARGLIWILNGFNTDVLTERDKRQFEDTYRGIWSDIERQMRDRMLKTISDIAEMNYKEDSRMENEEITKALRDVRDRFGEITNEQILGDIKDYKENIKLLRNRARLIARQKDRDPDIADTEAYKEIKRNMLNLILKQETKLTNLAKLGVSRIEEQADKEKAWAQKISDATDEYNKLKLESVQNLQKQMKTRVDLIKSLESMGHQGISAQDLSTTFFNMAQDMKASEAQYREEIKALQNDNNIILGNMSTVQKKMQEKAAATANSTKKLEDYFRRELGY